MQLQKKFNNEKWLFYHNLSSPNQKNEKRSILENFGPLRSNFLDLDMFGTFWI